VAKKINVKKTINEAKKDLKTIMQNHLSVIGESIIDQIGSKMKGLTPSNRLNALNNITPKGVNEYKSIMLDALTVIAIESIEDAKKSIPKAKKVKLAAPNIDKLPAKLRDKIITRNQLLVGKQVGDLQAVIEFAYATNEDTTDSDDQVLDDMRDSALGFIDGTAIEAGSGVTASTIINEAREAFFFDDEVLEEVDAFMFVNGDPVSPICQDLAGTIFDKNDPNLFRYTPPLHWNCKSYIEPVLKGDLGNREVEKLKPSKSSLDKYVQFSDNNHKCDHKRMKITFEECLDKIHHFRPCEKK
jgi:hypothetical protein